MSRQQSVFGVLLAQEGGDHLLLPNVAVLEVGNVFQPPPGSDSAPWWRGQRSFESGEVPVVDFERLNGGGGAEAGASRTRAIFVQTFGHMLQNPVVALLCRGHPHLVDGEPESLQPAPLAEGARDDLVLCRARLGNTLVAVPDLDTLEAELAQAGVASR